MESEAAAPSDVRHFREITAWAVLMLIGFYIVIQLMLILRTILEPFMWAVFLVMGIKPAVDIIEHTVYHGVTVAAATVGFVCPRKPYLGIPPRDDNKVASDEEELETLAGSDDETVGLNGSTSEFSHAEVGYSKGDYHRLVAVGGAVVRGFSVLVTISGLGIMASGFGVLVVNSARNMQTHWEVYQAGAVRLAQDINEFSEALFKMLHIKVTMQDLAASVLGDVEKALYSSIADILNNVSHTITQTMIILLYVLFWLCAPVPVSTRVDTVFRKYIMMKSLACLGYGLCVGTLLYTLSVDLAVVFGMITMVFNYIPEVGPFIAMVLPTPLILLDSRLQHPWATLMGAALGQLCLKFAWGNVVEVTLIDRDVQMRMHPVCILLSVAFFGSLWGPTGMLLSVPFMALVKLALLGESVPEAYRDPILVILEGDRQAPRRHKMNVPRTRFSSL
mmetsp:Transcript_129466/g.295441  ORF Transcript_129466/g.295441 Transcript_129466/m.295441 type:complete len:448 (+) Transcript_129466:33-1376(+)